MTTYELEPDVLLARDGDEAAFRRLVDRCANTVCSIALAIVRDVHASEDVAQEVFLAAWSNLRTLRNPASFLPWLRQVTRNQAHLWRRRNRLEISHEDVLSAAVDGRPAVDRRLLDDEESRALSDALDRLPDDAREVLVLYYREESSTRQVATLLGISEAAVRQRVARSRRLLREDLLERFGRTASRTAPGAVFGSAIAAALTAAAPTASAAVAATSASTAAAGMTATGIAKATAAGAVLGWAGVLMGLRAFAPPFDEVEARDLRRFRNVVLLIVTIGCAAVAVSIRSVLATLVVVQTLYVTVAALYAIWLPRVLRRRIDDLRRSDVERARQTRRRLLWSAIGPAVAAAIGGLFLMAVLMVVMR